MNQFFKFFFASCLGILVSVLLVVVAFGMMAAFSGGTPEVSSKSVLKLDLNRVIPEKSENVQRELFDMSKKQYIGVHRIADLIENAATDSNIKGILINGQSVSLGKASQSIIREALKEFKKSEKFVYAFGDFYSQSGYYISSVADSIYMNPVGGVDMKGFGVLMPYFKDMFDRNGVKAQVFYAGDFKSATEPFRRTSMSEPNKIQTRAYLEDMVAMYKEEVAEARGISADRIDHIMENLGARTAEMALEENLIDKIAYIGDVESVIKEKTGREGKKMRYISLDKYNVVVKPETKKSDSDVAVLIAEGSVAYGSANKGEINEKIYLKEINRILRDDDIKAVVLRVNSGGGSALTSEKIWKGIEDIKASGRKVVASFGDVAASGGYYIACGADKIVAQPNTITGSIGVFGMIPNIQKLLNEKIGINFDTLKTHTHAVGPTLVMDLSGQEENLIQEGVDRTYEIFLNRVAKGRSMSRDAVHEVAQGRVWTGKRAKENGLVDELGDLEYAIDLAAELAEIEDYETKYYPRIKQNFIDQIMKNMAFGSEEETSILLDTKEIEMLRNYKKVKSVLSDPTPQARMPFIVVEN